MTRIGITPNGKTPNGKTLIRVTRALLMVAALGLLLAACGKKGPPEPPGPPDKVIYPKSYPTR